MRAIDKVIGAIEQMGFKPDVMTSEYRPAEWKVKVVLEAGCVWVNGFGKPMMYDRSITISHDKYGYYVGEVTGYNMSRRLVGTGKADEVIRVLTERLGKQNEI